MFTLPTKAIGWLRCSKPASHEQHSINLRTYYATGTFCGYFCGVNILTMTKRYDKTDTRKKPLIFSLYLYLHVYIGRFHKSSGRTNRLAFVRVMSIYVVLSSSCSSRQANHLEKNVFSDDQISDEKCVLPVCTSICSSEMTCPFRRFRRSLVWKRPLLICCYCR